MWKVGGTKIERTQARYIVLVCVHGNSQKSDFLGKTLRTEKFSRWKLSGMERFTQKITFREFPCTHTKKM